MAVEKGPKLDWSVIAATDLEGDLQYRFVKWNDDGSDTVEALDGAGQQALGVLNNAVKQGEESDVTLVAAAQKLRITGTVARGDKISASATGLGKKAATGELVYGRAHEAGTAGQVISVSLNAITPTTAA
jgi:hypothetical protein